MKRAIGRGLAGLAGIFVCGLLGCAQGGAAPALEASAPRGAPLLWRAEAPEGGGAFYLLGSVHMGDTRMLELGDTIRRAYEASDELVVEIDLSSVSPSEVQVLVNRFAVLPAPKTLEDVLPEETWQELTSYLESRGVAPDSLARMKPWFVSLTIVQIELTRAGYQEELGVDQLFIGDAAGTKPIVPLETLASQFEVFDSTSRDVQEILLADTLSRVDELAGTTDDLVLAWEEGDEARLEELVFQGLRETPELDGFYERLFFERNRRMVARLLELGQDGKTRFVVLGAGHMLGEEGIPALLARQGYRVELLGD